MRESQAALPPISEIVMNIRHATLTLRHRKNALFEQEHTASLDYDKQRSGGTPSKAPKNENPTSNHKKKKSGEESHRVS
jgi:hypothetical protein